MTAVLLLLRLRKPMCFSLLVVVGLLNSSPG